MHVWSHLVTWCNIPIFKVRYLNKIYWYFKMCTCIYFSCDVILLIVSNIYVITVIYYYYYSFSMIIVYQLLIVIGITYFNIGIYTNHGGGGVLLV